MRPILSEQASRFILLERNVEREYRPRMLEALQRKVNAVAEEVKAAPGWSLTWAILLLLQGLLPASTVYLTRRLVDSLVVALGPQRTAQSIRVTLLLIALIAAIMLLTEILRSATVWVRTAMSELMQDRITS